MLLAVLEMESQLTAKASLYDLEDLVNQRDRITQTIATLEEGRLKMVAAYLKEKGLDPNSNLEAVAHSAPPEIGLELRALKAELLGLVEPLNELAAHNARVGQARANCFDEVHKALHRGFKRQSTYSQFGMIQKPKGSVFLTRSV